MKVRNTTDDELFDFISNQSVEPGAVITVPDEFAESYEDHPNYEPVPDVKSSAKTKDA